MSKSPEEKVIRILRECREILKIAKQGLEDLINNPNRRMSGISNVSIYGRAVTNYLQRLRHLRSDFDDWYSKFVKEMENDDLLKYFYDLRTDTLKKNLPGISNKFEIKNLQTNSFDPKPDDAEEGFMDNLGTGWKIRLPDNSLEKYYINIPDSVGTMTLYLNNPPSWHLGKNLKNTSAPELCKLYLEYLNKMLTSAENKFLKT